MKRYEALRSAASNVRIFLEYMLLILFFVITTMIASTYMNYWKVFRHTLVGLFTSALLVLISNATQFMPYKCINEEISGMIFLIFLCFICIITIFKAIMDAFLNISEKIVNISLYNHSVIS